MLHHSVHILLLQPFLLVACCTYVWWRRYAAIRLYKIFISSQTVLRILSRFKCNRSLAERNEGLAKSRGDPRGVHVSSSETVKIFTNIELVFCQQRNRSFLYLNINNNLFCCLQNNQCKSVSVDTTKDLNNLFVWCSYCVT